MKKDDNGFGKWLIDISNDFDKATPKKRTKMIKELSGELDKLCKQINTMSPFDFFVWLRFSIVAPALEQENIKLHEDIEVYFLIQIRDTIRRPSDFLTYTKIMFSSAEEAGINPMTQEPVLDVCMKTIGWAIQNFNPDAMSEEMKLEDDAVKELAVILDPYFKKGKKDPAAAMPISGGTLGQIYHLILATEASLHKLCSTKPEDIAHLKKTQEHAKTLNLQND
ncbi:MAG: hypothetical protein WC795_01195 [Candidatus Paceibacterota bacterium]|jgi:hypothetical protein